MPLPFLVQQHPPVHLLRGAVKEIGAALALAHLDVAKDVVAAFRLHAEHLVEVGGNLLERSLSTVDAANLADALDKFNELGSLARPPQGRGIGRYVVFLFVLGGDEG